MDSAALNAGGGAWHADDDEGRHKRPAVVNLPDEVLDHFFGDFEISNHAISHRANGFHVYRSLAEHVLGLLADRIDNLATALRHIGNDRGFIELDALPLHIDQRVRCPEVNGHVRRQHAEEATNHVVPELFLERPSGFARHACAILYTAPYTICR